MQKRRRLLTRELLNDRLSDPKQEFTPILDKSKGADVFAYATAREVAKGLCAEPREMLRFPKRQDWEYSHF